MQQEILNPPAILGLSQMNNDEWGEVRECFDFPEDKIPLIEVLTVSFERIKKTESFDSYVKMRYDDDLARREHPGGEELEIEFERRNSFEENLSNYDFVSLEHIKEYFSYGEYEIIEIKTEDSRGRNI